MKIILKALKSRTIQLAILQALSGLIIALLAEFPEADAAGVLLIAKSLLDIVLRADTNSAIKDK